MTDKEKFIKACMFAIIEMRRRGSCSVALECHSENPKIVLWEDVLEWLDDELEKVKIESENGKG